MELNKKISFLIVITTCLQGCISSTYISSIGAREQFGVLENNNDNGTVKIYESKMEMNGGPCISLIPYLSLSRERKSEYIKEYPYLAVAQPNLSNKIISLEMENNKTVNFQEQNLINTRNKEINRTYRKVYGYPAQAFQVVAIPLDIGINLGLVGVAVVVLPVSWIIHSVHSPEKAKHE